jgi:hypothetical protein
MAVSSIAKRPAPPAEDDAHAKRPAMQRTEETLKLFRPRPDDPTLLFSSLHSDCDVVVTYQGQQYVVPAHLVVLHRLRELHGKFPVLMAGLPAGERRARIELGELSPAALDLLLSACYCVGQPSAPGNLLLITQFDQIHELLGPGYAIDALCCGMVHWLAGPGQRHCSMQLSVLRRLALHRPDLMSSGMLVQLCTEESAKQLDRRDFDAVIGALLQLPAAGGAGGAIMTREIKSGLFFMVHARWLHAHPDEALSDADVRRLLEVIAATPKPLKVQISQYASTPSLALRQLLLRLLCTGEVAVAAAAPAAAGPSLICAPAPARQADQPPRGSPSK